MKFAPLRGYLLNGPQSQLLVAGSKFSGWPVYASPPNAPHTEVIILTKTQYEALVETDGQQ